MTWSTSLTELKGLLSDGDTDKNAWRKRVLGLVNGSNKDFKTFEPRRVTNLVSATSPLGVFVDGAAVTVTADDLTLGQFSLTTAPTDGQVVEASYYYRWFIDLELTDFLENAMQWLGRGDDVTQLESGLQGSALKYAASEAYQKLSIKWAEQMSQSYKLEDQADPKAQAIQNPYASMSKSFLKAATDLRDDFYKRQGQSLAPLFSVIGGKVREVVPKE